MTLVLGVLAQKAPFRESIMPFLTHWNSEHWRALSRQFTNVIPEEDLRHFNRAVGDQLQEALTRP